MGVGVAVMVTYRVVAGRSGREAIGGWRVRSWSFLGPG